MTPAAAADVEAELTGARVEPALQRPHYRRRDAGGMPVHAHDAAVGLEPERVAQPREEGGPAVVDDDAFGDRRPERRHARGEPCGHAATVQREIGNAGTLHNLDVTAAYSRARDSRRPRSLSQTPSTRPPRAAGCTWLGHRSRQLAVPVCTGNRCSRTDRARQAGRRRWG